MIAQHDLLSFLLLFYHTYNEGSLIEAIQHVAVVEIKVTCLRVSVFSLVAGSGAGLGRNRA